MNKKIIILFIFTLGIVLFTIKSTFSKKEYFNTTLSIDYKDEELLNYIDLIDNIIYPISTYTLSENLNENYDFIVKFAQTFIFKNQENYKNIIKEDTEYTYIDEYNNKYTTNKFINIKDLYKITYDFFGKKDFQILDNNLLINNELVPLIDFASNNFSMTIDKILEKKELNNKLIVSIKYQDIDLIYTYIFEKNGNKFYIKTIDIGE